MSKFYLTLFLASFFMFSSCGNSETKKNEEAVPATDTSKGISVMKSDSLNSNLAYVCPCGGCPEIKESKPGKCSKCGIELEQEKH